MESFWSYEKDFLKLGGQSLHIHKKDIETQLLKVYNRNQYCENEPSGTIKNNSMSKHSLL